MFRVRNLNENCSWLEDTVLLLREEIPSFSFRCCSRRQLSLNCSTRKLSELNFTGCTTVIKKKNERLKSINNELTITFPFSHCLAKIFPQLCRIVVSRIIARMNWVSNNCKESPYHTVRLSPREALKMVAQETKTKKILTTRKFTFFCVFVNCVIEILFQNNHTNLFRSSFH